MPVKGFLRVFSVGLRKRLGLSASLGLASVFAACTSRPPEAPVSLDALALLKAASTLTSVALVRMDSRDTLYRFTPAQVDSFKSALKKSYVSENLQLTPSPWPVALVLKTGNGSGIGAKDFVALYYGKVLRVNSLHPWSIRIADSAGNDLGKGIADIVLGDDDEDWIWNQVQKATDTPPSKPYQVPRMHLEPLY